MPPDAVRLFGRPELLGQGGRTYLGANQVHRFVAYLAVRDDWVARDEVVFLFWPDRVDAAGRRNLRKLLHRARQLVAGIDVEDDRIRWRVTSDLGACRDALRRRDSAEALALVRGPLLEGVDPGAPTGFVGWLDDERERVRTELADAVAASCAELEATDPGAAALLSQALLRSDPLDERAVASSLRTLAAGGHLDAAERVYATYVRALDADLGVAPSDAIQTLHRTLAGRADTSFASQREAPPTPLARKVPAPWGVTSFVGRRAELAALEDRLAAALAGEGGVVVVEGEAGVGKTRLVETFLAGLPDGVRAFAGRCFERDLSAPLEPVRAALGLEGATTVAPVPEGVRFAASEARDPGGVHRALTSRLTQAAAAGRGAVLFVDDLQWSDAATLEFLTYTALRILDERVLIVVSHRREDRTVLERWKARLSERRAIRHLRLGRFDAGHTRHLVARVLGGNEADVERVAAFVHDESEGNPFYALEYLRWLRDTHQLEPDAARISAVPEAGSPAATNVPESIRSLIWARYRGVDDGARSVLDAAAAIGRSFSFDVLECVVGGAPETVWATLEPLIEAGLIVAATDGTYAFSHDKLRQTVYASLGPPATRALHARVLRALEAEGAGDAELAHHALRAELWPEAYARLQAAARSAEADSAWEVARTAYARMLAIAPRLEDPDRKRFEALQAIERLLEYMGRRPAWIDTIERLDALADRIGDPAMQAEAALKRMAMRSVQGDRVGATEAFERADALFEALGDAPSRARGYREVAYLAWMRGDYAEVIESSFAAMAIQRELGQRRALAATAENVSHAYRWLDDDAEAERWAEQAAATYEELGDRLAAYVRLDIQAWVHLRRGEEAAAATVLERLLPICVQLEDKHLLVEKLMSLGKIHLGAGRYQRALDSFEAATREGAATGDLRHEGYPRISAGVALEGLGAYEDAERSYLAAARLLAASYVLTRTAEDEIGQGDALVLHAGLARRHLGRPADARTSLASAATIFARSRDAQRSGLVQMELGALHWGAGELEQAAEAYQDAFATATRTGMPERAIAARASLGVVYRDLGRLDESIAAGREAVARVREGDDPLGEAFLLTSLASSYQRAGRTAEARASLERSLRLRRRCGDESGATAMLAALAALPAARDEEPRGLV